MGSEVTSQRSIGATTEEREALETDRRTSQTSNNHRREQSVSQTDS